MGTIAAQRRQRFVIVGDTAASHFLSRVIYPKPPPK